MTSLRVSRAIFRFVACGQSVAELPDTDENRRADISGGWQFKDGKVVQRVYSPEELSKKAEAEKFAALLKLNQLLHHWCGSKTKNCHR